MAISSIPNLDLSSFVLVFIISFLLALLIPQSVFAACIEHVRYYVEVTNKVDKDKKSNTDNNNTSNLNISNKKENGNSDDNKNEENKNNSQTIILVQS